MNLVAKLINVLTVKHSLGLELMKQGNPVLDSNSERIIMTVTAPASLLTAENQAVMENYYDHTNVGDFLGATQFLSDDVVYRIPGPPSIVAYSGEWVGKERVVQLFQAFNSAFSLVDMVETRTVTSPSEVLSINDEIFVARGTGRPWRVGVVHHMKFRNGKIYSLTNYTDIVPAIQALAGRNATEIPMLPSDLFAGESSVPSEEAAKVIGRYYEQFPNVDDLVNDDVTALMPGDPRRLRWSGKWSGRRDSNSRRPPWQGGALPTELHPQF